MEITASKLNRTHLDKQGTVRLLELNTNRQIKVQGRIALLTYKRNGDTVVRLVQGSTQNDMRLKPFEPISVE